MPEIKVKVRATFTVEWEESSKNWTDPTPGSKEELLERAREYVEDDYSYALDGDTIVLESVEEVV
jgi:hypothetical protein